MVSLFVVGVQAMGEVFKVLDMMKFFVTVFLVIILCVGSEVDAGEIRLHFPHFAGHQYDWQIFQGDDVLTVLSGQIPPDGRVTLVMPGIHDDYRGMTRWLLKKGGGLDMIYVGRGFSVECLLEQPGSDNIIYTGDPENDYLKSRHRRQQAILDKLGAINHLLQVYPPEETLHKTGRYEQELLRQAFEKVQADRAESPLYAARFGEIVDFTRGIADRIYDNPEDHIDYFNGFVTHTLDFNDLYTSGHWNQVIHHWLMINIRSEKGGAAFSGRLDKVLSRMGRDDIVAAFTENTVSLLVEKGRDDLLPTISGHLTNRPAVKELLSRGVKTMMASVKILTGRQAPDLIFHAPVRNQTGRVSRDLSVETENLGAVYTILLFYQGECRLCEDALIDLANKYQWLSEQNVRVIAISADTTDQGFEKKQAYHLWPDNYCDFTGMAGENFMNYGVLGVPTLFLLDREGVVVKKAAMLEELIKTMDENHPN